ncbi:hypothetical protein ACET3Z_000404 [Daucus carota]
MKASWPLTGSSDLSSSSLTLLCGFLAVLSVHVVIAFYICLAMREPVQKHEPDPKFLSEATASVELLSSFNLMRGKNLHRPIKRKSRILGF